GGAGGPPRARTRVQREDGVEGGLEAGAGKGGPAPRAVQEWAVLRVRARVLVAGAGIDLGELGGARDSELCARLEDSRHRDLDVAVGHDGGAEQLVERRVLENAPPSEIAERVALLRRVSPVRGHD